MSLWRRKAIETFPGLRREIAEAEGAFGVADLVHRFLLSAYGLWLLDDAYGQKSFDEAFVRSVYDYGWWLLNHSPVTEDAALCMFYGAIVDYPEIRQDMHRWLTPEQFHTVSGEFEFSLGAERFVAFRQEFEARRKPRRPDAAARPAAQRRPRRVRATLSRRSARQSAGSPSV